MYILSSLKLPARLDSLHRIIHMVSGCTKEQRFSKQRISEIEIAVEEALVNIFEYSYAEENGNVEVVCKLDAGNFVIEIIDSGIPFNILTAKEPDITSGISERSIGGLGIFLIRKLMDDVRYRREGDRNILTLVVKKPGDTP
jgi:anti-sigma regulatory factor (Ser/Thr protein kinase)